MEIGIIGSGMIGGTLARLLSERGHKVQVGVRNPDDPRLSTLPPSIARTSPEMAIQFGSVTIVAIPFFAWQDLAPVLRPLVSGRVVLDTSNAIPGRDGITATNALASGMGSGSAIAALLPEARIVKAFNTIYFATLVERAGATPPLGIPLAGDEPAAVALAASVVAAAGFASVPAGPLRNAAQFDFGTNLFNVAMSESDLRQALSLLA